MSAPDDEPLVGIRLDQLSTHLATLEDAQRFFFRYGSALRSYLIAILRDRAAADEVLQELVLALLSRGGAQNWPGKGRYRDYLKRAARNAAIDYLRKQGRQPVAVDLEVRADPRSTDEAADRALTSEWQRCVLDRVWRELEVHERQTPGNLFHTVLRVVAEFPHEESPKQAQIASQRAKRTLTAEAFRKQVSRARRLMADIILTEVARSIAAPTAEDVEGELVELGLWNYVAGYLAADWRTRNFGK